MRSEGEEEGELAGAGQQLKKCSVQAVKNIWRKKKYRKMDSISSTQTRYYLD